MARNTELIATYRTTRNIFESGEPESPEYRRTIIANAEDSIGNEITIKGDALPNQLFPGMAYRFFGQWRTHHKYGDQFVFSSFVAEAPATEAGVVAYLSQLSKDRIDPTGEHKVARGIGKGTAHMLWELYQDKAVEYLRDRPALVATAVKSLSPETAKAASEWLKKNQAMERCKIDLIGLLDSQGFPKQTIDLCIARYGARAANMIRANPYLLMQFPRCGFGGCDQLYLRLGHPPDRLKRQTLCIWNMIAKDSEGHTWHPLARVEAAVRSNVAGSRVNPAKAIKLALRSGMMALHTDASGQKWIADARKADNEKMIAQQVALAANEVAAWPRLEPGEASEHQAEQLDLATRGVIGCLAGGPGTGKTYTAAALINAIVAHSGEGSMAICAPTGKAAVRLTEALQGYGIGIEATTIHRLLKADVASGNGWSFLHGPENPLDFRYVLIDESSMIDTDLMAALFAARKEGTHFLFIGDHRQLAPVGHGCPFLDLQRAGVPTGELTEVRRNSGQIVRACAQIRESNRFDTSPKIDPDNGDNLFCWHQSGHEAQTAGLKQFYESMAAKEEQYDPVWDIQVLVAVNKKSPLSRKELNAKLQEQLNPGGQRVNGNPFRIGDKIINLKNGKFPCDDPACPDADEDGNVFVANGEQAEVLVVDPARTVARLQSPDRVIVIPHGQAKDNDSDSEDSAVGSAGSWDLAYAISVHKSQGSEWPMVVVMLDDHNSASRVCSRNWIYTAISRAKKMCLLIGQSSTAQQMARRDGLRRKTFLAELISPPKPANETPESNEIKVVARLSYDEFLSLLTANV